jgi:hypothetical protein
MGWDGMGLVGVLERKMTEGNCCRSVSLFKLLSSRFLCYV